MMKVHAHLWRGWAGCLAIGLAACGQLHIHETPVSDAGPTSSHFLVEDFDNRSQLDNVSNEVVVDLNQGIVTLMSQTIPALDDLSGESHFDSMLDSVGLVENERIVVTDAGVLEASDTVEMRAADAIQVSGVLRAGTGGVTLIAKNEIAIDGAIESRGPVRLVVSNPNGRIVVRGRIETRVGMLEPQDAPHVELRGRGRVEVTGCVLTRATGEQTAGHLLIDVYGDVNVNGAGAMLASIAHWDGTPGRVRIASQNEIAFDNHAIVGAVNPECLSESAPVYGGDIVIQGRSVQLSGGSKISVPQSPTQGDLLHISAFETVRLGPYSRVESGSGTHGGKLSLRANEIRIDANARLAAGSGRVQGGDLEIEASRSITLDEGTDIEAGAAGCGPGGATTIQVAGLLSAMSTSRIQGGHGGTDGIECPGGGMGGNVTINARTVGLEISRENSEVLQGGPGFPVGQTEVNIDAELTVPPPEDPEMRQQGTLESISIPRPTPALGQTIELTELVVETPQDTSVHLEIAGADTEDGPFVWQEAMLGVPMPDLQDAAWIRYRVRLFGKDFDAPRLDYFQIDLASDN